MDANWERIDIENQDVMLEFNLTWQTTWWKTDFHKCHTSFWDMGLLDVEFMSSVKPVLDLIRIYRDV